MRLLILLFGMVITLGVSGQVRSIPDFSFKRMDNGAAVTGESVPTGKKTLFVFFDTECPHCMMAITEFNEKHKQLDNISIYLITKDPKDEVMGFLKNFGPQLIAKKNCVLLSDTQNQFIGKFLPKKYPSIFLFATNRQLLIYTDEEKEIPVVLNKIKF